MPAFSAAVTSAIAVGNSVLAGLGLSTSSLAVIAATGFLTQAALGLALNALTPKPVIPNVNRGYQINSDGSAQDFQIIYGEARVGGARIYKTTGTRSGDEEDERFAQVIAIAGHEVDSFTGFYIDENEETFSSPDDAAYDIGPAAGFGLRAVTNPKFARESNGIPRVLIDTRTGTPTQTAFPALVDLKDEWTTDHKGSGIALLYTELQFHPDIFPSGVPEITALVKGKKVYDPRNVAHDVDDPSTWEWSDNPALCIADYLMADFGLGELPGNIDWDTVATAANVCDSIADNGEKFFTCNGAFTTATTPYNILNDLLSSMGGLLWYSQGKWRMKAASWQAPTMSLTEDDLRSPIAVKTRHSRRDNFNTVRGTFRGPETSWAVTDFPEVTNQDFIDADNGQVSALDVELPFTDNSEEARRIARITLERNRQQLTVSASFGLRAFALQVGDVVNITNERFAWTDKPFEVVSWTFGLVDGYDLQVQLVLRETAESIFDEVDDGVVYERDNSDLSYGLPNPVQNLTATAAGAVAKDGTFVNSILVDWDAPLSSRVKEYHVEWFENTFDFDSNGGIVELVDAVTTREQFIFKAYVEILFRQPDQDGFDFYNTGGGSSLTEAELRAQLRTSPEASGIVFKGVKVNNSVTEYSIVPVLDDTLYNIRVRAVNPLDAVGPWNSVTFSSASDGTTPSAPTSITATGGFQYITIKWTNPADLDFSYVEVYEADTNNSASATLVGTPSGNTFTRTNLGISETKWYFLKSVDYTGNKSDFTSGVSATTTFIDDADFENGIRTLFEDQGLFAIEDVASLPASGTTTGEKVFNRSDGKLYEWNGSSWVLVIADVANGSITATKIDDGAITTPKLSANAVTAAKIAAGTITGDKITANTITGGLLATSGIITNSAQINNSLITNAKIENAAITNAKIAGGEITADKLNVTNIADISTTYSNDSTVSGLTVGTLISAANNGMRSYRYSNTSTGYAFSARNYVGPAGQFQANINNSTGSYDGIVATNGGGSGSTAIDARSTRTGGGHAQIALTVNDGGYGIFLPATSADGGLDASGGGWSPFTGVHMGMLLKTCTCVPGDILTDHSIVVKTISDTFGEVKASTGSIQAGAIGVLQKRKPTWVIPPAFIDKDATRAAQESAPEGTMADLVLISDPSVYHEDYDLVDINSVGEGAINVIGENGNISKGDLIVTSSTPGKGMKQSDDIVRSYTVAKAREDVTFSSPTEVKMVACIYLCG